ncbi:MAG: hypothetical protein ABH841_01820 [Candidatus Nealsonbacteria bacterium]
MSLFGDKKQVPIKQIIGQAPAKIPGTFGQVYPRQELIKELKTLLPYQQFGSYLSVDEAKIILRKLRSEEYRAQKADQKLKLGRLLRILEEDWGLKGKY